MLDSEYFFYFSLWSYVVDKCGNERKKLPLYEIWRRRIQSQGVGGSTQIRYEGGGSTAVMTSVRWKCGNCHFTQASVEPQMGIQTLLSPQNIRPHTKRDFFGKSNLESVYQAALNGWLSRGGGRGVDSTITRSHSKRQ